ncbi:MAG: N-acetylglucosamine-6-phosphate deacetylase [Victivallaceae bacterium]|nr:N-acetylglucosamine-6-phosphate deacetylase [Victivallaceae bacterium]
MRTLFVNAVLVTPDRQLQPEFVSVLAENGRTGAILPGNKTTTADRIFDCEGAYLMPGFWDLHCHGKLGCDVSDGKAEDTAKIAAGKLAEGVTTFLPTTMTLDHDTLATALAAVGAAAAMPGKKAKMPGVHLEGPYINPHNIGAQNPGFVRAPDLEEVAGLSRSYPVAKVSFAPEMAGGAEFAAGLLTMGIVPSAVHSSATYEAFRRAYDAGLRNLSHFCNQMSPLHHRDIGLVGAGLLHDDVYLEMICDKLHLSVPMIELIFHGKNLDHLILISDAVRACGMPDGRYTLGGLPITLSGGEVRLVDGGALAGSALTLNRALQNVAEVTGLGLPQLCKTCSLNPARSLGVADCGKIEVGYVADYAILDASFDVKATVLDGEVVFAQNSH